MDVKKIPPGGRTKGGYPVPSAHVGHLHIGGHTHTFFYNFSTVKTNILGRVISVELIGSGSNLGGGILPTEI